MTLLVLFILAVIWAAVLLPPYLQNRSESRPADSISSFQRQLSVLERRSGSPANGSARATTATSMAVSAAGMSRFEARKRRRDVLFTLALAATLTFPLAAILGGPVWALHVLCDLLLVAYVVLLALSQQRMSERESKVHYLPGNSTPSPEPALLLRRSGS